MGEGERERKGEKGGKRRRNGKKKGWRVKEKGGEREKRAQLWLNDRLIQITSHHYTYLEFLQTTIYTKTTMQQTIVPMTGIRTLPIIIVSRAVLSIGGSEIDWVGADD